jgi:hypothetical protein
VRLIAIRFGIARGALAPTRNPCSGLFVVLTCILAFVTSCGGQHSGQPPLLEISEVKRLVNSQASTEPAVVAFRGVVTYSGGHILFVEDKTGGIKVDTSGLSSPPPINTLVEARGLVLRTSCLPILVRPVFSTLAAAKLPLALPARAYDLPAAGFAGRLVEVRGLGQSAGVDRDGILRVRLRDGNQVITARMLDNADFDRDALPGTLVTVRGVADPVVNADGEVEEYRLWSSSAGSLKVVKASIPRLNMPTTSVRRVKASFSAATGCDGAV